MHDHQGTHHDRRHLLRRPRGPPAQLPGHAPRAQAALRRQQRHLHQAGDGVAGGPLQQRRLLLHRAGVPGGAAAARGAGRTQHLPSGGDPEVHAVSQVRLL